MKNILAAQSRGPTSAINATLAGVITCALTSGRVGKVFGAHGGIQGVLEERIIDLGEKIKNAEDLQLLCQTPAAALGSCRLKLTDESQYKKIIEVLHRYEIGCLVYIGGNDSMDTVEKLSAYCMQHKIDDICIVGAPKTIDNDLMGTDHCPGFGSAAKYIASTFAELERDCSAYAAKSVTIVEVMGRDSGWLTGAAALARQNSGKGPDLIYLCESVFDSQMFLSDIRNKLRNQNSILIAVSEGIKDQSGRYVSESEGEKALDAFGHTYISGAARVLECLIQNEIGCKTRSIELNLMQRCAGHLASDMDIQESKLLGIKACQAALDGENGKMAAIIRTSDEPYEVTYKMVPVSLTANKVKTVPDDFIDPNGHDVTDKMIRYLKPLIQGNAPVTFENGIVKHISLY